MKKTTIISGLLLASFANAQSLSPSTTVLDGPVNTGYNRGGAALVSEPTDTVTIDPGSVACSAGGFHADNSYFRQFDLSGLGQIEVTDVDIGIENAAGGMGAGSQPIVIRLHSIADGDALPTAAMTLVSESITTIADLSVDIANFPIVGNLDSATQDLVVEVFTPDGQDVEHALFMGANSSANNFGETFLLAVDCSITEPTAVSAIGFPDMHTIVVVNGFANVPVELMNFSIE